MAAVRDACVNRGHQVLGSRRCEVSVLAAMSAQGSITFVPSVHFSPTHRRRVRETIRAEAPDLVAVELDEFRFEHLDRDRRPTFDDVARTFPSTPAAATYGAITALQRTVVRLSGLDPETTDMEAAIETAAELDTEIALIDERIAKTLAELSSRVSLETLPKLCLRMQRLGPQMQAAQIESLTQPIDEIKHGDDVQPAIDQLRQLLPEVAEVMIDRRDRVMAQRLHRLRREGNDVVAVIGAGHHNGIQQALEELESGDADPDPEISLPIRSSTRTVVRIPIN
jgi:pheromone shutdown protein TraB